ncbi:hypothetical protein PC120_g25572 [Phytophthora cactorum]|nr:hypothetical protein PC120_g25572 [Phytophthora cactorum]
MREDVVRREPIINVVDELLAQPIPTNNGEATHPHHRRRH